MERVVMGKTEENLADSTRIPESLFGLFWELEPETIHIVRHGDFVMGRIMERGNWEAMHWLLKTYSKEQLASMEDIACMKLSAVASRKDFFDLHHLMSHVCSLEDCLRLYMEKYQNRDIGHVIRSLVYFVDADGEPEVKMIRPVDWDDVKNDFEKWVKSVVTSFI